MESLDGRQTQIPRESSTFTGIRPLIQKIECIYIMGSVQPNLDQGHNVMENL